MRDIGGVMVSMLATSAGYRGVMVSVLASSAGYRGFEPRSGQIKYYEISICWFSANHGALKRKKKDGFARNQDNMSV